MLRQTGRGHQIGNFQSLVPVDEAVHIWRKPVDQEGNHQVNTLLVSANIAVGKATYINHVNMDGKENA